MEELIKEYKEWKKKTSLDMDNLFFEDEKLFLKWLSSRDVSKIVDAFEWLEESYDEVEDYNE